MRSARSARVLAVLTALGLVIASFAASPATAAKKKKKKKCPAMAPAEAGAEAPITVVTPKATEEAPIEIAVEAPAGLPEVAIEHVYQNVQVDNKGGESGLYLRYEFTEFEDYDVYLLDSAGEEVARSAGFNPIPVGPFDGTGNGGHSEQGAEQIDGFATPDCGGYTVDLATYMGEGGELVLKAWLGEIAPPEEE